MAAKIRDLAREHGAKAIERLVALMDSRKPAVALRAAEAVLDRGYGRPLQAMKLIEDPPEKSKSIDLKQLTDEELKEFINARKAMRRLIEKYTDVPTPWDGRINGENLNGKNNTHQNRRGLNVRQVPRIPLVPQTRAA